MRVLLRTVAAGLAAGGLHLVVAPPAMAREQPPTLDVERAVAELSDKKIYRAPGAVAHVDESWVLPVLDKDTRVLVAPFSGIYGEGAYADGDAHSEQVTEPLDEWATEQGLHLIVVEGLGVNVYGEPGAAVGPTTLDEVRHDTAYLDVTASVVFAARFAAGVPRDQVGDFDYPVAQPVPPTPEQVDELAARLEDSRVYNAPGRDDPVDPGTAQVAEESGLTVRIAALPAISPGQPLLDYAPELLKRFPNDVVMVAQGAWLDIAAANQAKAESARNYAYGRFEYGSFRQGIVMGSRISTILERLPFLLRDVAYGRPQPRPQPPLPQPQPYDVRRTISDLTPWVLVGAALILGGAGLHTWRRNRTGRADAERRALRRESARAMARIGELGARLLAAEERGQPVDPAAAERHATARALYDQALTAEAMAEVTAIADEGIEVGV